MLSLGKHIFGKFLLKSLKFLQIFPQDFISLTFPLRRVQTETWAVYHKQYEGDVSTDQQKE